MNGIRIRGTGRCVPDNIVTNEDLARIVETDDAWITARTGIRQRHHCTTETHTDLCVTAARRALEQAGVLPEEIGVCIVASATPEDIVPAAACRVQELLGLPEDTLCFDISAACTGFVYALHTAECLLNTAPRPFALVIGGEVLSRVLDFSDRTTCILFGDGAGAAVAESVPGLAPAPFVCGTRGGQELLQVPGVNGPLPSRLRMEGTAVFRFAAETIPAVIAGVLQQAGIGADDVDFFVFHQANARIIELAARKYKIPADKYALNIAEYGNTSAASVPILLAELRENGRIHSGDRVLMAGFGGGMTWGAMIVTLA